MVKSDALTLESVQKAMEARFQKDSSGQLITLSNGDMPQKSHVYELEKDLGVEKEYYMFHTLINVICGEFNMYRWKTQPLQTVFDYPPLGEVFVTTYYQTLPVFLIVNFVTLLDSLVAMILLKVN